MTPTFVFEFTRIVKAAFIGLSFEVTDLDRVRRGPSTPVFEPDLILTKGAFSVYCEVKFYRSTRVPISVIRTAASKLADYPGTGNKAITVSCLVPSNIKEEIYQSYEVVVWDRSNLANFLTEAGKEDKLEELGVLIMEAQQGNDTDLPYEAVDEDTERDPLNYFSEEIRVAEPAVEYNGASQGDRLIDSLAQIPAGKPGWIDFEKKCVQILMYLFDNDLSAWNQQLRTDDELSRFDMICRVNSQDDFWRALVNSFYSRFVLFEFKNYSDPILQGQIYTTERYLFPKALRGAAIIIARNGAHENALAAAKGALREHGKLILVLNMADLLEMIRMKDNGDLPSDYLSDKLDEHLMSLSR